MGNLTRVYTAAEAADRLGVIRRTVSFMVARGELSPITGGAGKPFVFDAAEVEALVAARAARKEARTA